MSDDTIVAPASFWSTIVTDTVYLSTLISPSSIHENQDLITQQLQMSTLIGLSTFSTISVVNPVIISLNDLVNSHAATEYKESLDKQSLTSFINPVSESLMPKLFEWAKNGFPTTLLLQSITIELPQVCSDGIVRDMPQYFKYLIGMTLLELDDFFATKFEGFNVLHSYNSTSLTLYLQKP
jgi:hypothetical protein